MVKHPLIRPGTRHCSPAVRPRAGFTLTELLIVIAIMVLVLAAAVPVFNAITGSRSLEAAENRIAATLAQARMRAIAERAPRGVVFYRDPANDRIAAALVRVTSRSEFSPVIDFDAIELLDSTDPQHLPVGVDVAFKHVTGTGASDYVYRFLTGEPRALRGLILFDANGQFLYRSYGIGNGTELARRMELTAHYDAFSGDAFYSQPAFLLFEREVADQQATDLAMRDFLNANATVILVNRYTGALTASE